ncbi:hypothetical protein BJF93_15530 [Xaviernesmea oryzae]|uniref:Uncharacterized protein n=1 Tax=Xaviernesmea oryzae TaxID=464029 RepID=A0A1Q9AY50_9HYPH|nr:hypothetical protein [Xaviernesmea oryzae]OLP60361.1 hypothetical protein BJF93_15530 [Xaviernesmea oryzae]
MMLAIEDFQLDIFFNADQMDDLDRTILSIEYEKAWAVNIHADKNMSIDVVSTTLAVMES